mgnify:CR=1 FL=1|jgi:hypothetical protein
MSTAEAARMALATVLPELAATPGTKPRRSRHGGVTANVANALVIVGSGLPSGDAPSVV